VLVAASIGFGIGLHLVHHGAEQARAREHSLDTRLAALTREHQGYIDLMHQPANAALLEQSHSLNELFDEKTFSWTLAMEDLEVVLPGGVAATALDPTSDKQGNITLHLRVLGPHDREVELVQNLEHSRRFLAPRITGETAEQKEGANAQQLEPVSISNRFNFDILAEYNPATIGELTEAEKKVVTPKHGAEGQPEEGNPPEPARLGPRPKPLHPSSNPGQIPPAARPGRMPTFVQPGRPLAKAPKQGGP